MGVATATNGRRSNGAKTAAGKLMIARANTTNILERLQARRLGEPVLAPVSVDMNVTGRVQGEGD
jgi:hypothetical protein